MAKRIEFQGPGSGTTTRYVHLCHQEDLVLDAMLGAVTNSNEQQVKARAEAGEDTPLMVELDGNYGQWMVDELMKFGLVSLYHFWEKQLKSLLREQLGDALDLRAAPGRNDADRMLHVLEHELSAPTSAEQRALIHECRQLVNLIKHDPGTGYEQMAEQFPNYFKPEGAYVEHPSIEDLFRIAPNDLRRFYAGLKDFWDRMPHHVDYSHMFTS